MRNFSKSKIFVEVCLSFLVALLAVFPQFWAHLRTPNGYFFSGINANVYFPDIEGVYFPSMFNSSRGEFLYRNPFDPSSEAIFHLPLYFILGKIVGVFSLSIALVYHITAFILTFIFSLFIFKFLKLFFKDSRRLLFAFGLVNFGGLFFSRSPEGIGLFSYAVPHLVLAQLALFVCLYDLLLIAQGRQISYWAFGFWAVILSVLHPWMVLLAIIFCLILSLVLRGGNKLNFKLLVAALILSAACLPILFYYVSNIPWVSFRLPTSPFILVALYGFLLPIAVFGVYQVIFRKKNSPFIFLGIWFILQIVFVHLPLSFSRRFVEGMFVALAVFAVVAVDWISAHFKLKWSKNLVYINFFLYLSLGVFANYLVLFSWLPNAYVYKPVGEREAMVFLDSNSKGDQKVFSLPISGSYIPGYSDVKIFVGQSSQTPGFERKAIAALNYYEERLTSEERDEVLKNENICFVYVGPFERSINKINFAKESVLIPFFENKSVAIYKTLWCQ